MNFIMFHLIPNHKHTRQYYLFTFSQPVIGLILQSEQMSDPQVLRGNWKGRGIAFAFLPLRAQLWPEIR